MRYNGAQRGHMIRRYVWVVFTSLLFFFGPLEDSATQTRNGVFLAGTLAFALQPEDDLVDNTAIGAQIGYRFPGGLLILGEYLYTGTDYYYYDQDKRRWTMATGWSDVPSGPSSRSDWLFYRDRHAVGLAAGLSGRFAGVGLFTAAGFMLSIIDLSDAEDTYPDFAAAAEQSSIGDDRVLFSTTLRGGLVFPAESALAGQLAYVVQLDRDDDFGETRYFRRNSLIYLGVTIQHGGR